MNTLMGIGDLFDDVGGAINDATGGFAGESIKDVSGVVQGATTAVKDTWNTVSDTSFWKGLAGGLEGKILNRNDFAGINDQSKFEDAQRLMKFKSQEEIQKDYQKLINDGVLEKDFFQRAENQASVKKLDDNKEEEEAKKNFQKSLDDSIRDEWSKANHFQQSQLASIVQAYTDKYSDLYANIKGSYDSDQFNTKTYLDKLNGEFALNLKDLMKSQAQKIVSGQTQADAYDNTIKEMQDAATKVADFGFDISDKSNLSSRDYFWGKFKDDFTNGNVSLKTLWNGVQASGTYLTQAAQEVIENPLELVNRNVLGFYDTVDEARNTNVYAQNAGLFEKGLGNLKYLGGQFVDGLPTFTAGVAPIVVGNGVINKLGVMNDFVKGRKIMTGLSELGQDVFMWDPISQVFAGRGMNEQDAMTNMLFNLPIDITTGLIEAPMKNLFEKNVGDMTNFKIETKMVSDDVVQALTDKNVDLAASLAIRDSLNLSKGGEVSNLVDIATIPGVKDGHIELEKTVQKIQDSVANGNPTINDNLLMYLGLNASEKKVGYGDLKEQYSTFTKAKDQMVTALEAKSDNSKERAAYYFQTINQELKNAGSTTQDIVSHSDDVYNHMKANGFYGTKQDLDNASAVVKQMYGDKSYVVNENLNQNVGANVNLLLSGINTEILKKHADEVGYTVGKFTVQPERKVFNMLTGRIQDIKLPELKSRNTFDGMVSIVNDKGVVETIFNPTTMNPQVIQRNKPYFDNIFKHFQNVDSVQYAQFVNDLKNSSSQALTEKDFWLMQSFIYPNIIQKYVDEGKDLSKFDIRKSEIFTLFEKTDKGYAIKTETPMVKSIDSFWKQLLNDGDSDQIFDTLTSIKRMDVNISGVKNEGFDELMDSKARRISRVVGEDVANDFKQMAVEYKDANDYYTRYLPGTRKYVDDTDQIAYIHGTKKQGSQVNKDPLAREQSKPDKLPLDRWESIKEGFLSQNPGYKILQNSEGREYFVTTDGLRQYLEGDKNVLVFKLNNITPYHEWLDEKILKPMDKLSEGQFIRVDEGARDFLTKTLTPAQLEKVEFVDNKLFLKDAMYQKALSFDNDAEIDNLLKMLSLDPSASKYKPYLNQYKIPDSKEITGKQDTFLENMFRRYYASIDDRVASDFINNLHKHKYDLALDAKLANVFKDFGIQVRDIVAIKNKLKVDSLGVFDVLNKVVYVSKNRNILTLPEEYGHVFTKLLDKSNSELYSEMVKTLRSEHEDFFKQVEKEYSKIYKGNTELIEEEAIGQILGAALIKKDILKKNLGFWEGMLKKIMDWLSEKIGMKDTQIKDIFMETADKIFKGDFEKIIEGYNPANPKNLVLFEDTIKKQNSKDGGKALKYMQKLSDLGIIITGSLSYRKQGSIYRKAIDALHDIDTVITSDKHGLDLNSFTHYGVNYIKNLDILKKIDESIPGISFYAAYSTGEAYVVHGIKSDFYAITEEFLSMKGNFNDRMHALGEEKASKLYLFDFFLRPETSEGWKAIEDKNFGILLDDYTNSFRSKLSYNRPKDIADYRDLKFFKGVDRTGIDENMMMYQLEKGFVKIDNKAYQDSRYHTEEFLTYIFDKISNDHNLLKVAATFENVADRRDFIRSIMESLKTKTENKYLSNTVLNDIKNGYMVDILGKKSFIPAWKDSSIDKRFAYELLNFKLEYQSTILDTADSVIDMVAKITEKVSSNETIKTLDFNIVNETNQVIKNELILRRNKVISDMTQVDLSVLDGFKNTIIGIKNDFIAKGTYDLSIDKKIIEAKNFAKNEMIDKFLSGTSMDTTKLVFVLNFIDEVATKDFVKSKEMNSILFKNAERIRLSNGASISNTILSRVIGKDNIMSNSIYGDQNKNFMKQLFSYSKIENVDKYRESIITKILEEGGISLNDTVDASISRVYLGNISKEGYDYSKLLMDMNLDSKIQLNDLLIKTSIFKDYTSYIQSLGNKRLDGLVDLIKGNLEGSEGIEALVDIFASDKHLPDIYTVINGLLEIEDISDYAKGYILHQVYGKEVFKLPIEVYNKFFMPFDRFVLQTQVGKILTASGEQTAFDTFNKNLVKYHNDLGLHTLSGFDYIVTLAETIQRAGFIDEGVNIYKAIVGVTDKQRNKLLNMTRELILEGGVFTQRSLLEVKSFIESLNFESKFTNDIVSKVGSDEADFKSVYNDPFSYANDMELESIVEQYYKDVGSKSMESIKLQNIPTSEGDIMYNLGYNEKVLYISKPDEFIKGLELKVDKGQEAVVSKITSGLKATTQESPEAIAIKQDFKTRFKYGQVDDEEFMSLFGPGKQFSITVNTGDSKFAKTLSGNSSFDISRDFFGSIIYKMSTIIKSGNLNQKICGIDIPGMFPKGLTLDLSNIKNFSIMRNFLDVMKDDPKFHDFMGTKYGIAGKDVAEAFHNIPLIDKFEYLNSVFKDNVADMMVKIEEKGLSDTLNKYQKGIVEGYKKSWSSILANTDELTNKIINKKRIIYLLDKLTKLDTAFKAVKQPVSELNGIKDSLNKLLEGFGKDTEDFYIRQRLIENIQTSISNVSPIIHGKVKKIVQNNIMKDLLPAQKKIFDEYINTDYVSWIKHLDDMVYSYKKAKGELPTSGIGTGTFVGTMESYARKIAEEFNVRSNESLMKSIKGGKTITEAGTFPKLFEPTDIHIISSDLNYSKNIGGFGVGEDDFLTTTKNADVNRIAEIEVTDGLDMTTGEHYNLPSMYQFESTGKFYFTDARTGKGYIYDRGDLIRADIIDETPSIKEATDGFDAKEFYKKNRKALQGIGVKTPEEAEYFSKFVGDDFATKMMLENLDLADDTYAAWRNDNPEWFQKMIAQEDIKGVTGLRDYANRIQSLDEGLEKNTMCTL